jgi:hypothetical protein
MPAPVAGTNVLMLRQNAGMDGRNKTSRIFEAAPGFRGACHRAGRFGPDPLVQSGLRKKKEAERQKAQT